MLKHTAIKVWNYLIKNNFMTILKNIYFDQLFNKNLLDYRTETLTDIEKKNCRGHAGTVPGSKAVILHGYSFSFKELAETFNF